jgi:hypothetical protein
MMPPIRSDDPFIVRYKAKLAWSESDASKRAFLPQFEDPNLSDMAIDALGVLPPEDGSTFSRLLFCSRCLKHLRDSRLTVPKFALANNLYVVPMARLPLPPLTFVEESVIARIRLASFVVKLTVRSRNSQLALKGHVIGLPLNPDQLLSQPSLPPPANALPSIIHVLFVKQKSVPEGNISLEPFRKIFSVNREKITLWLRFLQR